MAITVTNTNALSLLGILNKTQNNQSNTLTQLSTGSRINRGSDDPAGLIALRGLDTELKSVDAAVGNNQRTDALLGVADGALNEISSMLNDIQELVQKSANSAGVTASEVAANQAQIDNAIAAIDRIVGSTEFNGKKLLDGSLAINTKLASGDQSKIKDINVYSSKASTDDVTVKFDLVNAASSTQLSLTTAAAASAVTFTVQGNLGTATIEVTSGLTQDQIVAKINDATAETGVSATNDGGTVKLDSGYGSSSYVRTSVLSGDEAGAFTSGFSEGTDAVVEINGQRAAVDGLNVSYNSNGTSLSFTLDETFNQGGSGSFDLTVEGQGGATFRLGTTANTDAKIGIQGMQTQRLGSAEFGYLSDLKSGGASDLLKDPGKAAKIVKAAAEHVATSQGRIGGFQKFQVKTSLNALQATKEGLTSARSVIADVDFATATAELNRQNVLLQSSISLLGLANQQSSQILSLLR
jgi:flagellin